MRANIKDGDQGGMGDRVPVGGTPLWNRVVERWRVAGSFALVLVGFIATTVYAHLRSIQLDGATAAITDNAAPSIRLLTLARAELHDVRQSLWHAVEPEDVLISARSEDPETNLRLLVDHVREYRALPAFEGELALARALDEHVAALDQSAHHVLHEVASNRSGQARAAFRTEFDPRFEVLRSALLGLIDFNAAHIERLTVEVRRARAHTGFVTLLGDAFALAIAGGLLVAGGALSAARRRLDDEQRARERERADELEAFAGRVAHDVLSPLGTVSLFTALIEPAIRNDARLSQGLHLARNALRHTKQLVNDLLAFAHAGARPPPDARADVHKTTEGIVTDLAAEAAEAGIQLRVEAPPEPIAVACMPGILMSLLQNLVRNAIKYMGDSPRRRIDIRVSRRNEQSIRFEVHDTGPGLPSGLEAVVFQPFVRGPSNGASGIGLGLATVKRLAETHGGTVGVDSRAGGGTTFWFVLPAADGSTDGPSSTPGARSGTRAHQAERVQSP